MQRNDLSRDELHHMISELILQTSLQITFPLISGHWVIIDEPIPKLGIVNIFGALEVSEYFYISHFID